MQRASAFVVPCAPARWWWKSSPVLRVTVQVTLLCLTSVQKQESPQLPQHSHHHVLVFLVFFAPLRNPRLSLIPPGTRDQPLRKLLSVLPSPEWGMRAPGLIFRSVMISNSRQINLKFPQDLSGWATTVFNSLHLILSTRTPNNPPPPPSPRRCARF
ncbi:hypothetical protein JAAARDRAFT_415181 [Jaapia argillacea MUCL 33604]|uniref:Uncharacterized protein n=1 Tax=Jaapia argillacea MUCL 33604 TaxID=933084 RepID=A0A067PGE4_9AGAM|nr:hypothetical protein JAAARDRAFT_415181 [Jaapia argillacea MUCL 33604]